MTELAPCPFCGGKNVGLYALVEINGLFSDGYVYCEDCHCEGPYVSNSEDGKFQGITDGAQMEGEAITAWNTRHETN